MTEIIKATTTLNWIKNREKGIKTTNLETGRKQSLEWTRGPKQIRG